MKGRDKEAEAAQRRFTLSVVALPMAYSNAGATGAIKDLTDDAEEMDFYVERLSNLPTSFTGIPEDRARNLVRILDLHGAKFELIPEAHSSEEESQAAYGVTISRLPKPTKDMLSPHRGRSPRRAGRDRLLLRRPAEGHRGSDLAAHRDRHPLLVRLGGACRRQGRQPDRQADLAAGPSRRR